jgi:hypothetical protein
MRSNHGVPQQVADYIFRQEAVNSHGEYLSQVHRALMAQDAHAYNMPESVAAKSALV